MPESPAEQETQRLWRLAGMGATMTSEILAGTGIGWLLDRFFGTKPTIMIIGTIIGVVVGMSTFLRSALRESKKAGQDATRIAADMAPRDDHEPDDEEGG